MTEAFARTSCVPVARIARAGRLISTSTLFLAIPAIFFNCSAPVERLQWFTQELTFNSNLSRLSGLIHPLGSGLDSLMTP